ncbi:MAG TPA: glycosyltransferase [Mycobacteriales bacterium]|nr:glycosyltransferase [Mycobacteriales bacterium]
MISVIVPAHNEEAVLARCLRALTRDAQPGELEVIVAANGCTDGTVRIADDFGPPVRVVAVAAASKVAALNAGEAVATGFPRFYVDADVEFDTVALRRVAAALSGSVLAAAPELAIDTAGSDPLVRSYYRVWCRLPSVRDDLVGRGVYALSGPGRARFASFPDVANDDHFIRETFSRAERVVVPGCVSRSWAPRSTSALIARKVRVQAGNVQIHRPNPPWSGLFAVVRRDPRLIVDAPAFSVVGAIAGLRARRLRAQGRTPDWGRDDSRVASSRI